MRTARLRDTSAERQSSVTVRGAGLRALYAAGAVRAARLRRASAAAVRAAGLCSGAAASTSAASAAASAVRADLWLREQRLVGRAVLIAQDDLAAAGHARPSR